MQHTPRYGNLKYNTGCIVIVVARTHWMRDANLELSLIAYFLYIPTSLYDIAPVGMTSQGTG